MAHGQLGSSDELISQPDPDLIMGMIPDLTTDLTMDLIPDLIH